MNTASLAFAFARRRPLATVLNVLLLAVGVATIAIVVLLSRELEARLTRDASDIDLLVGAKGSPLQLVLAGVYHADVPPGNIPLAAIEGLRANPLVREAIPIALGDSFRGFRIVGTEPSLVAHYHAALAQGSLWRAPLDAVFGSDVARRTRLGVGATFAGSHGLAEGGGEHEHDRYRVVGVLALTGIDSVWKVHESHHGDEDDTGDRAKPESKAHSVASPTPAPAAAMPAAPEREVTLALVKYRTPLAAATLPRAIDRETSMQAASPAYETARLLTVFGVGTDVIRGFALLLIAAAAIGLFVALTQALEERRYDLAIMRALGASRRKIVALLLTESVLLAAAGVVIGLGLAHGVAALIGQWLPVAAPLAAAAGHWRGEEWAIAALALGAAIIATAIPAWRAYRLDVAAVLAEG